MLPASAWAFKIESRSTSGLDGKIVMSPATERIETVNADGGDLIQPGMKVKRPIIIHNRSERTVDFSLAVSQVVGSSAELIVEVRHGVREGAAAWVQLEESSLTLKPGQQATIIATIEIPDSVKPGSKPFAITATQRATTAPGSGAGVAPNFAQTAIFIVELPGDAPIKGGLTNASLTSVQKSTAAGRDGRRAPKNPRLYISPGWTDVHDLRLTAVYENNGERLLSPTGRVLVKDVFGRTAGRYEIKQFAVYPDGKAATMARIKGLPSLGLFQATVELESVAAGKQTTTLPRFVLLPRWFVVTIGAFLLYGCFRVLRWQLRRRREWKRFLADEEQRLETQNDPAAITADSMADPHGWIDDPEDADQSWELDDESERMT